MTAQPEKLELEPWEPEETIGKIWHSIASRFDAPETFPEAGVDLDDVVGRLATFFRGLGGDASVEIRAAAPQASHHRLSFWRKLGTEKEYVARASYDGEILRLPARMEVFPTKDANAALYLWLTAAVAHSGGYVDEADPLRRDLRALANARAMTRKALDTAPGLHRLFDNLASGCLAMRTGQTLPAIEAAIEDIIQHLLGSDTPLSPLATEFLTRIETGNFAGLTAPRNYRPLRPVPVWPDLNELTFSAHTKVETVDTDGPPEEGKEGVHRARRRTADQVERKDSFILYNFESILSWAEFLNLNRRVDDDDDDSAKKAADDQDEIGLGQISKAPATRLKLHLDLAPEDVDREKLAGKFTYPEWDVRTGTYLPDHCVVLDSTAEIRDDNPSVFDDPRAARRIRAVRRQFEALRPGRVMVSGQQDGDDLDMEAAVRAQVDLMARGESTTRIWRQSRPQARDLAVSILLDVSRSTESAVTGRAVIDIEREALTALAQGLEACGDDFAINAFSSLKRDRVYLTRCKGFDEKMGPVIEDRIASLRPGFYTRVGAAIRHVSVDLAAQARKRRLLLVITDGKPNDLDHYEGRHGIEDTRKAVQEARRAGHAVFGITIDPKGKSWFPRMFGQGGYAVIANPDHLTTALPDIYRHLVGA